MPLDFTLEDHTLANGLRVVVQPDDTFLKPTIAMRCTASQASQAMKPVSLILPMLATAEYFEIVAIEPLSL